jgi:EAL domain-containing protein (putative c-di-GMP-specific phosphodiesterase class I)/GGDEF domain-containing protein
MSSVRQPVHDLGSLIDQTKGNAAFAVISLRNTSSLSGQHGLAFSTAAQRAFMERIEQLLRESDRMLALGGDKACVVFDQLMDDNHVLLAGLKLERAFEEPFVMDDIRCRLEVSAGLVYYGSRERLKDLDVDDLYRFAEAALGRAVERNVCFEISSEEAFAQMRRDWETNHELAKALLEHEITLDYQPKYRLTDGELMGAEAIVRWRKGGQIIPPQDFMPILTETRLWDLTIYSLRRAIREMSGFGQGVPIAISVDGRVLQRESFLNAVRSEINIWSVEPGRLALEVRESRFDDDQTLAVLDELRELGVSVVIDEFGRGQTSLDKLRDLPVDEIKIDRSFITNLTHDDQDKQMTEAIIDLAHRFEKTVIADGVEDAETFEYLSGAGCDIGQGFYLSAPLNEQQFSHLTSLG